MNRRVVPMANYQLSARVEGQGTPLVLLHGFPLDGTMWDKQVAHFARTTQTILPDLRGFGESSLASNDAARGIDMVDYAEDLAQILDALGIVQPVVLGGFSMGGYVVWQFALRFPQRVRALILCDTRAAADSVEAQTARELMAQACLDNRSSEPAIAMMPKLLAPETTAHRPEIVDAVQEMIRRSSHLAIAAAQRGMARRDDVRHRLGEIDLPALCLVGCHDVISPPVEMQDMAATLPQGDLIEIPRAGHMAPMENPDAVNDAIADFLSRVARP